MDGGVRAPGCSSVSTGSMLAPGPWGCSAENGDGTERGKDRGENSVIHSPGDGGAEQRQSTEQNKGADGLGVHFFPVLLGLALAPNSPPSAPCAKDTTPFEGRFFSTASVGDCQGVTQ